MTKNRIEINYYLLNKTKEILKKIIPISLWLKIKKFLPMGNYQQKIEDFYIADWCNERNKKSWWKQNPKYLQKGINLIGYLQAANGLGEAARLTHLACQTTDIPLELIDFEIGISKSQLISTSYANQTKPIFSYATNVFHINPPQLPFLWNYFPHKELSSKYSIGVWYWELPEFPNNWVKYFNLVDEVWVATQFVKNSIKEKTNIPVNIIPPCVEVEIDPSLSRTNFNLPQTPYLFLCAYDVLSVQKRKNPQAVINAFKLAFGKKDSSVGLAIKISNAIENPRGVYELKESLKEFTNCYFIEETFNKVKFNTLLSLTDAFVSLHRSEGFGLVPAESMYLGKPVVMTRWSGNLDFMQDNNCCGVDFELVKVGNDASLYDKNQVWANPSIEHAAQYMKKLANDKEYNLLIGNNAMLTIREQFSPKRIGTQMKNRLQEIDLSH